MECLVAGEPEDVEALIEKIREGPPHAHVESVTVESVEGAVAPTGPFEIASTSR